MLKGLVSPRVSIKAARFFDSPLSKGMIKSFVRKNHIDMSRFEMPEGGYKSFNDFFTRKMKDEYLPDTLKSLKSEDLNEDAESSKRDGGLLSPCDALLTISDITEDSVFSIKNTEYSLKELLRDEKLAAEFLGGSAFIFRLTPAHYHRYVHCGDGVEIIRRRIDGILHSVRPVCHEMCKVFVQNSREYVVIDALPGKIIQMEVGALLVGKISNYIGESGPRVFRGQEKGYFEYGGSSIVVLTQNRAEVTDEISSRIKIEDEIPVKIGERLTKLL